MSDYLKVGQKVLHYGPVPNLGSYSPTHYRWLVGRIYSYSVGHTYPFRIDSPIGSLRTAKEVVPIHEEATDEQIEALKHLLAGTL